MIVQARRAPEDGGGRGVTNRPIVTDGQWRPAADAIDDALATAVPPLTAEARQRLIVYAKGDAEWAGKLLEMAADITRDQGWPEIRPEAVRASLLQCWMRERRLPERPAAASAGPTSGLSDGPMAGPVVAPAMPRSAGVSTADAAPPTESTEVDGGPRPSRPLPHYRPLSASEEHPLRHAAGMKNESKGGSPGLAAATVRGERFSYLAVVGIVTLSVIATSIWLRESDDKPLSAGMVSPFPIAVVAPSPDSGVSAPPSPPVAAEPPPSPPATEGSLAPTAPPEAETVVAPALLPPQVVANPAETRTAYPTAERGDAASDVRTAQDLLARLGYRPGAADGRIGPQTTAAIRAFQRDAGTRADGEVTPNLLYQLQMRAAAPRDPLRPAVPVPKVVKPASPEGEILRTIGRWLGTSFNSTKDRAAVVAHCRAVPDDRIYDDAVGDVVPCSRFVDAPSPSAVGHEHP
jgi:hypothetical protein